jgi:predicted ABC-type ATPase
VKPQLLLLAGPNGAGKSTFYEFFLRDSHLPFLNADVLAANTGVDSFEAARILDGRRVAMIHEGRGFITETVFSDPGGAKLDMLRAAVEEEFDVELIYIGLASPALSAKRIEQRVARGGHDVPTEKLAARFKRSLANLRAAIEFVPVATLYDNTLASAPYRFVARFERGILVERGEGRLPAWTRGIVPPARRRKRVKASTPRKPATRRKR